MLIMLMMIEVYYLTKSVGFWATETFYNFDDIVTQAILQLLTTFIIIIIISVSAAHQHQQQFMIPATVMIMMIAMMMIKILYARRDLV